MVDLTLMVVRIDTEKYWAVVLAYGFGQVAALAIWAVRGRIHRLLRVSCFVLATGLLAHFIDPRTYDWPRAVFIYAMSIFIVALLIEVVRNIPSAKAGDIDQRKRWQFPVIEFFGWTIIIAVVSLGCREMEFREAFDGPIWLGLVALIAVPILLVLFTRKDLRDLRVITILIIVGAAITAEWYITFFIVATQAAYLVAWMTVLTFDNILSEVNKVQEKRQDETDATNPPKLYDPHPKDKSGYQSVPDDIA